MATQQRARGGWKLIVICVLLAVLSQGTRACGDAVDRDEQVNTDLECSQKAIFTCCMLFGIPIEYGEIRDHMPPKPDGNSMLELQETFRWIGVKSQGREITYEELMSGPFPLIAHCLPGHYVVVNRADNERVRIRDGFDRERGVPSADFKTVWDGNILVFEAPSPKATLPAFRKHKRGNGAWLRFNTMLIDKGEVETVSGTGTIRFEFEITNAGNKDMRIRKVRSSCQCTVAKKPEEVVTAGSSSRLEVDYQPNRGGGPFRYDLFVETDDPSTPVAKLVISGSTQSILTSEPGIVDFGKIVQGARATKWSVLSYTGDEKLDAKAAKVPGYLSVEILPMSASVAKEMCSLMPIPDKLAGRGKQVARITLDSSNLAVGGMSEELVVNTGMEKHKEIALLIRCEVMPTVRLTPRTVFLGRYEAGIAVSGEVDISPRRPAALEIVEINCPVPGLSIERAEQGKEGARLKWEFNSNDNTGRKVDDRVVVSYREAGNAEVRTCEIPVYGYGG